MALTQPENNGDSNNKHIGKKYREKVIATLPLSKQFAVRQRMIYVEKLNKKQAIEMLKECIVLDAHKDTTFTSMINGVF